MTGIALMLLAAVFAVEARTSYSARPVFVNPVDSLKPARGLYGANIAMWQSHGWYYEPKLDRWEWQRARIFQTVEDLYTQSYVLPFLVPMLENAGACVLSPRERDVNVSEVIVDADKGFASGKYKEKRGRHRWEKVDRGFAYNKAVLRTGDNPFAEGTSRRVKTGGGKESVASWTAELPQAGEYAVYVSYVASPDNASKALYRVNSLEGSKLFEVNQKWGGGTWIYLGHFNFEGGKTKLPQVELLAHESSDGEYVSADAVKIGGGMGNIERRKSTAPDDAPWQRSGYPRFTEGARYWLQWAGAPDSVYTESGNVNDYTDDYKSRALWVNWLTGGSESYPSAEGLGIPVDLSFAFHSDAGTTMNDSIIGTLGIYCTKGDTLGDGSSREASGVLTDMVMTSVVNDIKAHFEPEWTRRDMWNKSYYEARVPMVPAMLLELLSHQNFADMKYGLDPAFRFTVSRAIYKGMLRFLAERNGEEYTVQPLPVKNFAILPAGGNAYTLSWLPTEDASEPTAMPERYIVEERNADGGFRRIAVTDSPSLTVAVTDNDIHSYRIIAVNDGGRSFPSEILALRHAPDGGPSVMIVNGFTRVGAPDWFEAGDIAGFYDERDGGVPYIKDISYIGSQIEFRRRIPWMDDDAAGFGASRANYEDKVIAGNTFDYPALHGKAIAEAGYGFVSASVGAFVDMPAPQTPLAIDLILGKQKQVKQGRGAYGGRFKTFPAGLQNALRRWTSSGCSAFVSGSYVASDLWDTPFGDDSTRMADKAFASTVLGYEWRVGQATIEGEVYTVPSAFPQFSEGEYTFSQTPSAESYAVESPDSFYASDSEHGATIMRYAENNLVAAIACDMGKYRTVIAGFPFEVISSEERRASLMRQILKFFNDR